MLSEQSIDTINNTQISVYGKTVSASKILNQLCALNSDEKCDEEDEITFKDMMYHVAMDMAQSGVLNLR